MREMRKVVFSDLHRRRCGLISRFAHTNTDPAVGRGRLTEDDGLVLKVFRSKKLVTDRLGWRYGRLAKLAKLVCKCTVIHILQTLAVHRNIARTIAPSSGSAQLKAGLEPACETQAHEVYFD